MFHLFNLYGNTRVAQRSDFTAERGVNGEESRKSSGQITDVRGSQEHEYMREGGGRHLRGRKGKDMEHKSTKKRQTGECKT